MTTTNTYGDHAWRAGDDPATRCTAGKGHCGNQRSHGPLCGYHHMRREHLTRYANGPHTSPVDGCGFCPAETAGVGAVPGDRPLSHHHEERLAQLAALEDGWYDGDCPAPSLTSITAARAFVTLLDPGTSASVNLYPLADGGVGVEDDHYGEESWRELDVHQDGSFTLYGSGVDEGEDGDGPHFADPAAAWTAWQAAQGRLDGKKP